jgi:Tudor domain
MASSNMMSCYSLSNLEDVLQTSSKSHSQWTVAPHPGNVHFELPPKVSLSYMSSELDPGKVHEIRVTGIEEGIKKFVVQVKGCGTLRLELQQKLEKVQLQPLRIFVRGSPCLSVYYRNGTPKICRGLITFCVNKKCYVYFVDYGHVEQVDLGGLYEIPEELVNIKLQAYRVSLANAHDLCHIEGCTSAFTNLVTCKSLQFRCQVVDPPQGIMMFDQNGRNIKDLILLMLAKVPLKDLAITHIERTTVYNPSSRPEAPLSSQVMNFLL